MNAPTQQASRFRLTVDHETALLCHEPDGAYSAEDAYTQAEQIPLTSDMVFKAVFGSPGSEYVLAALLSAVRQDYGFPEVSELEITNPFNLQTFRSDKLSVVDARARDRSNTLFNIEVQSYRQTALRPRILYYWARSYSTGVREGEPYAVLRPVIGVAFVDFPIFGGKLPPHSCFELRERSSPEFVYNDHLSLHLLELPGFMHGSLGSRAVDGAGEPQFPSTPLERWVYFIGRAGAEDAVMKKIKEQDPMIARADEKYRSFINDEDSFFASLEHERWVRDRAQMILDGEERGRADGRAKGRAEGIEQVVTEMIAKGMDEQLIVEITGLSLAELAELKPKA
ncbi:MAG: Rpn family recombination-promoting nuclease/putative transposase [Spirochaetia bacterium]